MNKLFFGIVGILAVVLIVIFGSGIIEKDVQLDGLKIVTPAGYEKGSESTESEIILSNAENTIRITPANLGGLESFNEKYSTLASKNIDINGIKVLFKKYRYYNINEDNCTYDYMFNLNGKYFNINSKYKTLDKNILTEMLGENIVNSSEKIKLPDITVEETWKTDKNKDTSSSISSDSSSSGTESIFTNNVLERYDSDGDGKISRSEWNTWCSYEGYDSMSNCDTNGDGYCSRSELNAYSKKYGY